MNPIFIRLKMWNSFLEQTPVIRISTAISLSLELTVRRLTARLFIDHRPLLSDLITLLVRKPTAEFYVLQFAHLH